MKEFTINVTDKSLAVKLQQKIDQKTKPLGALGQLEALALQMGLIQGTLSPSINFPNVVVFAGDHGIARDGVTPYPQEVTHQMVINFLSGGAAINVFARQNGLDVKVVDAGVNYHFGNIKDLIDLKVGNGTNSFLKGHAMPAKHLADCIDKGAALVSSLYKAGCNCIAFGEMGIGNTSSAAMLMHYFTGINLPACVGRGTGLDDRGLENKRTLLQQAAIHHGDITDWAGIMQAFSGYEIAMMTGAMLQAAEYRITVLVDGFIASTAYLAAFKLYPAIKDYAIACHLSDENGHRLLLEYLQLSPLLMLGMRLGEGTGAAMAFPLVKGAVNFMNQMASFESAGVSNKE